MFFLRARDLLSDVHECDRDGTNRSILLHSNLETCDFSNIQKHEIAMEQIRRFLFVRTSKLTNSFSSWKPITRWLVKSRRFSGFERRRTRIEIRRDALSVEGRLRKTLEGNYHGTVANSQSTRHANNVREQFRPVANVRLWWRNATTRFAIHHRAVMSHAVYPVKWIQSTLGGNVTDRQRERERKEEKERRWKRE